MVYDGHQPRPPRGASLRVRLKVLILSGTWSWVKVVSVPESPSLGLYATVLVQVYGLLCAQCERVVFPKRGAKGCTKDKISLAGPKERGLRFLMCL